MSDATARPDRARADGDTERPLDETPPDDSTEAAAEYDSLPASEHVAHGEAGADLVDEPTEPDVPAQETADTAHDRGADERPALVEPPARDIDRDADPAPTTVAPVITGPASAPAATEPAASVPAASVPESAPPVVPAAAPASSFFVEPPVAPRARHNRGFGLGVALLGSLLFAGLYAAVSAGLIGLVVHVDEYTEAILRFLYSPEFWVPVIAYVVLAALAALILNRARWAAHVFLSLIVGILVYVISVGVILLGEGILTRAPDGQLALLIGAVTQPVLIAAALCAREVALWTGLATAARGRRVVARNRSERESYEEEKARAEAVWDDPAGAA